MKGGGQYTSALSRVNVHKLANWISFEQINGVLVSFAIACRKETTTFTLLIFWQWIQHFG